MNSDSEYLMSINRHYINNVFEDNTVPRRGNIFQTR